VTVLTGDRLRERVLVHRIITILDARCWEIRSSFGQLFANQLENAHQLVLNKVDLVDRGRLREILEEVHREIPNAAVVPAFRCRVDSDAVWSDGGDRAGTPATLHGAYIGHPTEDPLHVHADESGYVAFSFTNDRPLDETRFRDFLSGLPFEVFRVKGTASFRDRTDVVNLVGGQGEWARWDGEPGTRLAFVGWNVDGVAVLERLAACCLSTTDEKDEGEGT
jgi:G3E family GTPase